MATCFDKSGERIIIPATREAYIQPFSAPAWTDLRVGFFLSVTDSIADDDPDGVLMDELLANSDDGLPSSDRYWIGLKTNEETVPRSPGVVFMGYTNSQHAQVGIDNPVELLGDTRLYPLTGTNYWWPNNSDNNEWSAGVFNGRSWRPGTVTQQQITFPRNVGTVAAGYAALLGLRFVRPHGQSRSITMSMKRDADTGTGILFSNTPTSAIIEENLGDFPSGVGTYGPVQVDRVPDTLYFYWPFRGSRLRVHAIGVLKYR